MSAAGEEGTALTRLVRMGRERQFADERFEQALATAAQASSRGAVLRELLLEWTGLSVDDDSAGALWSGCACSAS